MSTTNKQVIHLWANQSRASARSSNGNCWFTGTKLYSYRTCIANFVPDVNGELVCLITTRRYSVTTTGKHMPSLSDIPPGITTFYVHNVEPAGVGNWHHHDNLCRMVEGLTQNLATAGRSRVYRDMYLRYAMERREVILEYALTFGLELPADLPEVSAEAAAEAAAYARSPEAAAGSAAYARESSAKEAAYRRQRKQEHRAALSEKVAMWRAGGNISLWDWHSSDGDTLLRVVGDEVETSRGARFPLEDAKRAFPVIARARKSGASYTSFGRKALPLGDFNVDKVTSDGHVHAGCHFVKWQEIERLAVELGILPAADSAA